jgi:hypothetical protein
VAWGGSIAERVPMLGEVRMERDASHECADAVQ